MKTRQEVRPETDRALRIFGYIAMALGFGGLTIYLAAPLFDLAVPHLAVGVAAALLAAGVVASFPKSALGHIAAAHIDGLVDAVVPGKPRERDRE